MRSTLDIDDDVMQVVRDIARMKNQGIGRALSDLARKGLAREASPVVQMEYGIPVWTHPAGAIPVTSELVRSIAEEE